MIERIAHHGKELAIIIRRSYKAEGISFLTSPDSSMQLGYMNHPAGHRIEPHVHRIFRREIFTTQEVLLIKSGRLRVDFYCDNKNYLESRELAAGDLVLLASGGHGFEMLEQTEIIEVKQGPYAGDQDKERFLGEWDRSSQ